MNSLRNTVYGTRARFGALWFPRAGWKFVVSVCCGNLWLPRDNWLNLVSNVIPFSQQKKYGSCCTEIHFPQRRNNIFISLFRVKFCLCKHVFDNFFLFPLHAILVKICFLFLCISFVFVCISIQWKLFLYFLVSILYLFVFQS